MSAGWGQWAWTVGERRRLSGKASPCHRVGLRGHARPEDALIEPALVGAGVRAIHPGGKRPALPDLECRAAQVPWVVNWLDLRGRSGRFHERRLLICWWDRHPKRRVFAVPGTSPSLAVPPRSPSRPFRLRPNLPVAYPRGHRPTATPNRLKNAERMWLLVSAGCRHSSLG